MGMILITAILLMISVLSSYFAAKYESVWLQAIAVFSPTLTMVMIVCIVLALVSKPMQRNVFLSEYDDLSEYVETVNHSSYYLPITETLIPLVEKTNSTIYEHRENSQSFWVGIFYSTWIADTEPLRLSIPDYE